MYNKGYFNSFHYNGLPTSLGTFSDYMIKFGQYAFSNEEICISALNDIDNIPSINFQTYDIAKSDGMGMSEYTFNQKTITVEGWIRAKSKEDMYRVIDGMKSSCAIPSQKFFYRRGDGKEIYTVASCVRLTFNRENTTINYIPFQIAFTTLEPFRYSKDTHAVSIPQQNSNVTGSIVYNTGSYKAKPVVYISVLSVDGTDTISLTMGGQTLRLSENIKKGDYIIIDSKHTDVAVNGLGGRDYVGSFPSLPLGETPFSISLNGTWSADIYIQREDVHV